VKAASSRYLPLLLVALTGILYFTRLSGTDLKEPNEPIAAQAALEMLQHREWIVPTVNGEPYPDKPPLLFWAICAASWPFGDVNELSARLPSALAALSLVLAVFFLTRGVLGTRGAFLGAATLAVSTFFVEQARYVQHDMLLCLGVSVAILALFRLKDGDAPAAAWVALAACALTFGILAKGPIGLALPAMVLAAEGLVERSFFRRFGALAGAGALALVGPLVYYALLTQRNGFELLETFLFRHNMDRFATGFDHEHPWWFFLVRSPMDLLPGTLLLPAAALIQIEDPLRRRFHRRLWIWILVPLVFFSFSASKRPIYMLPALPPIALLAGSLLELLVSRKGGAAARRLAVGGEGVALALLGIAGLATPLIAWRRAPDLLTAALLLAALAIVGAALGGRMLWRGNLLAAHGWVLTSLACVWLLAILWVLPAANPINSPRPFAQEISRRVPRDAPLMTYGLYRFRSGYIYYTRRLMPRLSDQPAVRAFLLRPERVFCILPTEEYEKLQGVPGASMHLIVSGKAGRRAEVLISNQPAEPAAATRQGPPGTTPASPPPVAHSENGPG
jgi:4-amino-4-deoxy-L-arabinose transferase-like glycosyltransferase